MGLVISIGVMYAREVVLSCVDMRLGIALDELCVVLFLPQPINTTHLQIKDALGVESPRGTELRTRMVTNTAGETLRNNMRH